MPLLNVVVELVCFLCNEESLEGFRVTELAYSGLPSLVMNEALFSSKKFAKKFRFLITLNFVAHAWSIKYTSSVYE